MANVSYAPGNRTALVGDSCWVLISASPDAPVVTEIWQRMTRGARLDTLVTALFQAGFDQVPDFALLMMAGDRYHVLCRGDGSATLEAPGCGPARVNGAGLATWLDVPVPFDVRAIVLGDPPGETGLRLPATAGILLASGVIVSLADEATPLPQPAVPVPHDPLPHDASPRDAVSPDRVAPSPPLGPVGLEGSSRRLDGTAGPDAAAGLRGTGGEAPPGQPEGAAGTAEAPRLWDGAGLADEASADDRVYDFLWEQTQTRSVEDAAIRPDNEESLFSLPVPDFAAPDFDAPRPEMPRPAVEVPPAVPVSPPGPGTWGRGLPAGGSPGQALAGQPSGLIESVPQWAMPEAPRGSRVPLPGRQEVPPLPGLPPLPPPMPQPVLPDTIPPSQLPQAPRTVIVPAVPGDARPTPIPAVSGGATVGIQSPDNTAVTIKRSDLPGYASVPRLQDQIGPTVQALLCARSHLSPPDSARCRVCGGPLPRQDPVLVPRPVLGVLRLSTGGVITLNQGVVMGRNPRAEFDGDERLHVVRVPGGDGDISRTHLKVTLDGWHVLVTDLESTNGTLVEFPGRPPQRLRGGDPMPIPDGTLVTLADGIYFRFEVAE